ncbi:hypothetical protein [Pseudonocardia sp. HH130630-07]|uniref:hypothetical protein n=1 Tax=Pseudonocardia sp. HH130630-07 TaxID=1690815 RepID=UPI00081533B8|nr:hypothetical protein [Pseudonocardia sp. HH130630-07]ANY07356.1 hypothetical protein AFB00_14865 [Pseudonocardia sp. HH130630-07]
MLMNRIPMDHLQALAEDRRRRLHAEAEQDRLARPFRRPPVWVRLLRRSTGTRVGRAETGG